MCTRMAFCRLGCVWRQIPVCCHDICHGKLTAEYSLLLDEDGYLRTGRTASIVSGSVVTSR